MRSRIVVPGFVQYARLDEGLVVDLLDRLAPLCNSDEMGIDWWRDRSIGIHEEWDPAILDKIAAAEVVLQCFSPNFFSKPAPTVNGYIWDKEIPAIEARGADVLVARIGLVAFPTDRGRARGYERYQHHVSPGPSGTGLYYKALDELERDEFARAVADELLDALDGRATLRANEAR